MKASEALLAAAALPACKGSTGRLADGDWCFWHQHEAVSFCPLGALCRVEGDYAKRQIAQHVLLGAAFALGFSTIVEANDSSDLMPDVWSEAIEAAEALGL